MRGLAVFFLIVALIAPASAFDWGGSLENTSYVLVTKTGSPNSTFSEVPVTRLWTNWNFDQVTTLLVKGNLTDTYALGYGNGSSTTNTFTGDIDYFVFATKSLWIGRTDFRDFSATVLNTKLDGIQAVLSRPNLDLKGMAGTSALLFKSGNTIVISEDDTKERQVLEDFRNSSTLWAPPRLFVYVEATGKEWIPDQTFHLGALVQQDMRAGEAKDGDSGNTNISSRQVGAPVSTNYFGAGGEGRIIGPFYWNLWAYLETGSSLTLVGPSTTVTSADRSKSVFQTWKTSTILAGMGNIDLSLVMPSLANLLIDLGVQMGSWDPDGSSVNQNNPVSPGSLKPNTYTGWVAITPAAGNLIFNPQPTNMLTTQLTASVKPFEFLQLLSVNSVFVRPSLDGAGAITESGLIANLDSQGNNRNKERYLGTESDLTALLRPTSDLGGSLGVGLFVPNQSAMTRNVEYKVQTNVNLSF